MNSNNCYYTMLLVAIYVSYIILINNAFNLYSDYCNITCYFQFIIYQSHDQIIDDCPLNLIVYVWEDVSLNLLYFFILLKKRSLTITINQVDRDLTLTIYN